MSLPVLPEGPHAPFVLLDDARIEGAGQAMLFRDPVDIVRADTLADVLPALERVEAALATGCMPPAISLMRPVMRWSRA